MWYFGEGAYGSFFALIAGSIGYCGSKTTLDSCSYTATMVLASFSIIVSGGAFGWGLYCIIIDGSIYLDYYYPAVGYSMFALWVSEISLLFGTYSFFITI